MDTDSAVTEAARALSARRRRISGQCVVCGQPFVGTTKRKYCSGACSSKAYQQRHPVEWAERNRANQRKQYQRRKAARKADQWAGHP